jgi:hypothetical protein
MRTCEWPVERHAVVLFEPKIFAEDLSMARPRFTPLFKFGDDGGTYEP